MTGVSGSTDRPCLNHVGLANRSAIHGTCDRRAAGVVLDNGLKSCCSLRSAAIHRFCGTEYVSRLIVYAWGGILGYREASAVKLAGAMSLHSDFSQVCGYRSVIHDGKYTFSSN